MKIESIELCDIGRPSGEPTSQWAKVDANFSYDGEKFFGGISLQLHVPRRLDMTIADIQHAAHDQAVEACQAMLAALNQRPLGEWDQASRA